LFIFAEIVIQLSRFRKISALLLSMLVLLASTSFTINMHFCMEQIESISFFNETKPCEMKSDTPTCAMGNQPSEDHQEPSNGCCEDQSHLIEGQEESHKIVALSLPDLHFVAILYTLATYLLDPAAVNYITYAEYAPPPIERDIPVLVQAFLI